MFIECPKIVTMSSDINTSKWNTLISWICVKCNAFSLLHLSHPKGYSWGVWVLLLGCCEGLVLLLLYEVDPSVTWNRMETRGTCLNIESWAIASSCQKILCSFSPGKAGWFRNSVWVTTVAGLAAAVVVACWVCSQEPGVCVPTVRERLTLGVAVTTPAESTEGEETVWVKRGAVTYFQKQISSYVSSTHLNTTKALLDLEQLPILEHC